jgi:5-methylcytosine-specific restriction endonuclease McrA
LLRHSIPDGDTDKILNRALSLLLDDVLRTKCASTSKPRRTGSTMGRGRHIPAAVKREVWQRDGGRCVFSGEHGTCGETAFLEYHHVIPFAAGGPTAVGNLQLRCRGHNAYEANSARAELGVCAVSQVTQRQHP